MVSLLPRSPREGGRAQTYEFMWYPSAWEVPDDEHAQPLIPSQSASVRQLTVAEPGRSIFRSDSVKPSRLPSSMSRGSACCEWGEDLLMSMRFQAAMAIVIVANAIIIGVETDHAEWKGWDFVEMLFLVVFTMELSLKMVVYGPRAFFNYSSYDFWWNAFDFFIVTLGCVDAFVGVVLGGAPRDGYATLFRSIRLMRILRIFRIVKFLKQLYMLAFGFALAAIAVFWVSFLMLFALYVCAIILVRTMGHADDSEEDADFLHEKFGSVIKAMLTLFEIMSSPQLTDYEALMLQKPGFTCFLVGFIIFGSFGMIALLTGVIGESMFEKNNIRMEEDRLERALAKKMLIQTCVDLFEACCKNGSESARREDLRAALPRIAGLFEQNGVDLPPQDLESMLDVIDISNNGTIDLAEFRHFIIQMAEGVRPLLIMELYYAVGQMRKRTSKIGHSLGTLMRRIEHKEGAMMQGDNPATRGLRDLGDQLETLGSSVNRMGERMAKLDQRLNWMSNRVEQVATDASVLQAEANRFALEMAAQQQTSSSRVKGSSFWPKKGSAG